MYEIWELPIAKELEEIRNKLPKNRCFCCNTKYKITLHHIIPRSVGGLDIKKNRIKLCLSCHNQYHNSGGFSLKNNINDKKYIERLIKLRKYKEMQKEFRE